MPYGTQKARDGDPVEWITMRLEDLGLFEKEEDFEDSKDFKRTFPEADLGLE